MGKRAPSKVCARPTPSGTMPETLCVHDRTFLALRGYGRTYRRFVIQVRDAEQSSNARRPPRCITAGSSDAVCIRTCELSTLSFSLSNRTCSHTTPERCAVTVPSDRIEIAFSNTVSFLKLVPSAHVSQASLTTFAPRPNFEKTSAVLHKPYDLMVAHLLPSAPFFKI